MAGSEGSFLVDGKYSILDLVDIDQLRDIFEKFTSATGFTIGFLDHPAMNILVSTGWRDICVKFHRECPATAENCRMSNARLLNDLNEPGRIVIEKCDNGLVDCAIPIIIKGKHIASLATGQLFLEEPDRGSFRARARKFGFDEDAYMKALDEIPVFSEEKVKSVTAFLGSLARVVSELGYTNLEIKTKAESLENEIAVRKSAEIALRESEEKYRALVETTDTGYVIIGGDGKVADANSEYVRLTGLGELSRVCGREVTEWTAEYDKARNAEEVRKCFETGRVRNLEIDYIDKNSGAVTPIEVNATVVKNSSGVQIVTLCRDITARRNIERRLKQSIAEKDTLLNELYHRTKNNMQVVCSMLALQSVSTDDERMKTAFKDMENRIHSIALVHQKLYSSHNLSSINLKEYLAELSALLIKSYGPRSGGVAVAYETQDINVLIDVAIPCGLIVNELFSNSLKHAFSSSSGGGRITVRAVRDGADGIEIGVSDDGAGVREGFDFRKEGRVGMKTVFAIGEIQLGGRVFFESDKGLSCKVRFKDSLYGARV